MRFIRIELPPFYSQIVADTVVKYPNANKIGTDFYEDLMFIVAQGYDIMWRFLVTIQELINEVTRAYLGGKIKNMRQYEAELFTLRMDLIDFADSEFARALKNDPFLKLEEKFELMVKVLDAMVGSASTPSKVKDEMERLANTQAGAVNTMQGNTSPGQVSSQPGPGNQAMTSRFFKGFSFMISHMFDRCDSDFHRSKEALQGQGYTRGGSSVEVLYKESLANKMQISDLVDKLWNERYLELFEIARNIEFTFSSSRKGKLIEVDHVASNLTVSRMRKMRDVNKAMKLDLSLDDVIDRKIMNNDVRVIKHKERKEQKQLLYALLDSSGSTDDFYSRLNINRIAFIKAVAIALGKKAIADGSVFYFRWFSNHIGDVYKLSGRSQWGNFLTHILNENASGGTNIDLAMHVASEDISKEIDGMDKSDMIIITDGTADVSETKEFLELKRKGMKFHFLCLEDIAVEAGKESNIQKLAETFQVVDLDKVKDLASYKPDFRKVV